MKKISYSDATLDTIERVGNDLVVHITDWQEKTIELIFKNLIGIHAYSPEGQEISELSITENTPEITHALNAAQEEISTPIKKFSFISSWTGLSPLTIYATSLESHDQPS